jgi:hypothetical protein
VYGPWGDHQRSLIQSFFFPKIYENPTELYKSQLRPHETFDTKIKFLEKTSWLFPFIRTPQTPKEKLERKGIQQVLSWTFDKGSNINWRTAMGAQNDQGSTTNIHFDIHRLHITTSNTNAIFGEAQHAKVCMHTD